MPWKSSSSSVAAEPMPMARSKSGAKSVRGQISSPIPVPDPYMEFPESPQVPQFTDEAQQAGSNSNPRHARFDQNQRAKTPDDYAALSKVQSGTQRGTMDTSATQSSTQDAGKRLSKEKAKDVPARKRSPIRNVLGRLFGRRKKTTTSQITTTPEPTPQRSSAPPQHTGKIEKVDPSRGSGANRSASLPVTEYDRALRSHSVGLDDVIAIQSARNSLAVDHQILPKKRNPESSSPYPLGARYIGDGKLAGLCPRPASVNDRDLRSSGIMTDDPNEIGRAITSEPASGLKRRSMSMSAMSVFEANQQEHRRRSQEMRELRESCFYGEDPLSPLSSEFPEDDALGTFDLDLPDPPRPTAPEPTTPEEPFIFGDLIFEEEAANRQQVSEATLGSRVNGIENRLHVLEDSVSLLRYKANPHANMDWKPSDATLSSGLGTQPSFSYPNARNPHHSLSMGMAPTSTRPSTSGSDAVFTEPISLPSGRDGHAAGASSSLLDPGRPTSEQTVRARNSQDLLGRHTSSLNEDQFAAILGLLEAERSARMLLEAQVRHLTRQLNTLLLGKQARHKPSAPVSVFEYDADESESTPPRSADNVWHPRHAATNGVGYDDDDDAESASQVYATPLEEAHGAALNGGYPGAEKQQEEGEDGASPRTMSLSRMTMGPMPTAVM
ncbi:hypothetical protein ISF_03700 [Cordyceps fumosorosea ARSEF 2679]|uniref:Uncharacterized protein n=1 Tax=Cordyceps fumosorosea (strain ARSEF 2679) TaxID=1081104 RepID=A0A167ZHI3_CORFA|nr:hypothetical protein ISF_03700 [Cordyceps fumosorosea ARSEF 2679]OAA67524.1 hypothetical protein ISF_03700 [Cordyceps fumosorosea ARSEF 2679]